MCLFSYRCSVSSGEHSDAEGVCSQQKTFPLQTQGGASTLGRKVDHTGNQAGMDSTVCEKEASKEDEIMHLKQTVAALEERVMSMQKDNTDKFKDVCGMLLLQKLEIQRLQEIIWALHPDINLDPAFTVNSNASFFASDSSTSFADLNIDED
jgi:hypothetical protein